MVFASFYSWELSKYPLWRKAIQDILTNLPKTGQKTFFLCEVSIILQLESRLTVTIQPNKVINSKFTIRESRDSASLQFEWIGFDQTRKDVVNCM